MLDYSDPNSRLKVGMLGENVIWKTCSAPYGRSLLSMSKQAQERKVPSPAGASSQGSSTCIGPAGMAMDGRRNSGPA